MDKNIRSELNQLNIKVSKIDAIEKDLDKLNIVNESKKEQLINEIDRSDIFGEIEEIKKKKETILEKLIALFS